MAVTFFGVGQTPTDNGTNTTNPTVVSPPASMQAGDLVVMVGIRRAASGTPSISQAGGQTWTSLTVQNANTLAIRYFWCIFNGNWTANPSITMGATLCNSAFMLVFRPDTDYAFVPDVALSSGTFTAPGSPFTVTITGITIDTGGVAIASWHNSVAITYGTLAGAGWDQTGLSAQYRNTSGSDQTSAFAYYIGSGATGNVSLNESAGTAGDKNILSFKEVAPLTINVSEAVGVSESVTISPPSNYLTIDLSGGSAEAVSVAESSSVDPVVCQISVAEAVGVSESLNTVYSEQVFLLEVVTVSISTGTDLFVNVSDSVSAADQVPTVVVSASQISAGEAVGVTDTPTVGSPSVTLSASEAVQAQDNLIGLSISSPAITASEAVGVNDSGITLGVSSSQVSVSEAVSAADQAPALTISTTLSVAEAVGAADQTPSVAIVTTISASEAVGAADQAPSVSVSTPQISAAQESISVSENAVVTAGGLTTLTTNQAEAVSVSDSSSQTISSPQISRSEGVAVAESASALISTQINVSESVTLAENASQAVSAPQVSAVDNVAAADSASETVLTQLNAGETITLSESTGQTVSASQITVSELVGVSESANVNAGGLPSLLVSSSEAVTVADSGSLLISSAQITVTDSVGVAENAALAVSISQINVSDAISVSETATVVVLGVVPDAVSVTDLLTVGETAALTVSNLQITAVEPIMAADTASVFIPITLTVLAAEAIAVSEQVAFPPPANLNLGRIGWPGLGMQHFIPVTNDN